MISLIHKISKEWHLGISAFIVISVSFVYGGHPIGFLPEVFGFEVTNLELKNIFRAIMGLYIAFGCYWIFGIYKSSHWRSATISNVLFMGGLAFGRLISILIDGVSPQFTVGLILETLVMLWGIYNLKINTLSRKE